MACTRSLHQLLRVTARRSLSQTHTRFAEFQDDLDHATGIEKREMLQMAGGNKDPFNVATKIKRGAGTFESPTVIPSAFEGRLVGCLCEGHRFAQWMWLEKGCPKRCECGHWFKLKEVEPI